MKDIINKTKLAIKSPSLLLRELNRRYYRLNNPSGYNEDGVDILSEDWDNMIILDGCRYDLFSQYDFPGELESRISRGSATPEFLKGNFEGKDITDTVYVTSNPQLYKNDIECDFYEVQNIWLDQGWDEKEGTVLPETVTERAIDAAKSYPEKRLIIHYMQPHFPFIGSDISEKVNTLSNEEKTFHIWMQMQTGKLNLDRSDLWTAYQSNFERAIPHVEKLLAELKGRTILTSDHGNLLGEKIGPIPTKAWGHPRQIYDEHLVKVPWQISDNGDRRTITEGQTTTREKQTDMELVDSRLENLGYL